MFASNKDIAIRRGVLMAMVGFVPCFFVAYVLCENVVALSVDQVRKF